ncbi:alpha-amylase family glycosyl hydrolase [Shouchella clausii]|uniref:alpha-amylase family glycosyl hydrolase n=1 Tax=Shouchella clausii TaxID=79880 RepID=UPI000BA6FF2B|nr:alpha-amylase family glycosyl hydrolase [Shouchella clausii]PAD92076.1 alpha-amlyase [Shouchella clausii]
MIGIRKISVFLAYIFMVTFSFLLTTSSVNDAYASKNSDQKPFSWENATVYFAITDRFNDGNPSNNDSYGRPQEDAWGQNIGTFHGGDLQGLTDKLNEGYFTDLGINTIWISAPYEQIHGWVGGGPDGDFAHYAYHGYYALDYTTVDQNMGTVEEMREFVNTAHEQGIRVVLDVVMNHPGYNTIKDMNQYGFGNPGVSEDWTPSEGQTWHDVHDHIHYDDASAWSTWWGPWIRAGIGGYESCGNSEITMCLAGLPDFRTELTHSVGLPPLLETKWGQERQEGYKDWIVPAANDLRRDLDIAPADYIVQWLAAWVEEFGIDGFRIDTAKHVELFRWQQLKDAANEALWSWREENPDAPGASWTDDFWMVGEVWGHGVGRSEYFDHGFDSIINFTFQGEHGNGPAYRLDTMEDTFSHYANQINTDASFNVLSYLSQHDTHLYPRERLVDGGTYLMLLPGGVKLFYGDETARPFGPTGSDPQQGTRSAMNWDSVNEDVLSHWQKMGQFRNNHLAVGAGVHKQIGTNPYTFSRTYVEDGVDDRVVVAVGATGETTIDVSSVFSDGQIVRDFYTGDSTVVENGKVTFAAHQNGVILVETEGDTLPSVSASPQGGEFSSEELEVTLSVLQAESGAYTIDGSDPQENGTAFADGDVLAIGSNLAIDESLILRLFAENEAGEAEAEYTFTKVPPYPQVFADPPGGSFSGDLLEVTLHVQNVGEGMYSIDGAAEQSFINGDVITIGEGVEAGEEVTLQLKAENEFGFTEEMYTFTKTAGLTVYFKKPDTWGTPHIYYYDTDPKVEEPSWGSAPEMEPFENGWYMYTIEGAESARILFKDDGANQWPGPGEDGFYRDQDGWFDGEWHPEKPDLANAITIYYKTGWTDPHIHYSLNQEAWTTLPGVPLNSSEYNGYAKITIEAEEGSRLRAALNNGHGQWDNNQGRDYVFHSGVNTLADGVIVRGTPK